MLKIFWLWGETDADGDVSDILVQARRKTKAVRRLFSRMGSQLPPVVVKDKLPGLLLLDNTTLRVRDC